MTIADIINVMTLQEERSFTRAANRLFISQSAVSQSIAHLEKELNVVLFLRSTNSVTPTETCRVFCDTGSHIVNLYQKLKNDMQEQTATRRIRIGTVSFFNKFLAFHEELETKGVMQSQIDVFEGNSAQIEAMTINNELDFCFTRKAQQPILLESEPLFSETLLFAVSASHPVCQEYIGSKEPYPVVSPSRFASSSFVMITNPRITPQCMQICEEQGYTPTVRYRTGEWNHVINYVISGKAIGFISCLHIQEHLDNPNIRFFRIDSPLSILEHLVAYPSRALLSRESVLYIRLMKEYLSCHPLVHQV